MNDQKTLQRLSKFGAVITDSHIVYPSGKHGKTYVNKNALYPHTGEIAQLCFTIALEFLQSDVEVVIGAKKDAIILPQWIARTLCDRTSRKVFGVCAEKSQEVLFCATEYARLKFTQVKLTQRFSQTPYDEKVSPPRLIELYRNEQLVKENSTLIISHDCGQLIAGKNVLVVEDVLAKDSSAKKVIEIVRVIGGKVVGLGALCGCDEIAPQDVANPPKLFALVNVTLDAWDETDCPLCAQGTPLNTEVGKGREFLARNADKYLICPNPECHGLAHYIDKARGIFKCPRCGAVPAGLKFE